MSIAFAYAAEHFIMAVRLGRDNQTRPGTGNVFLLLIRPNPVSSLLLFALTTSSSYTQPGRKPKVLCINTEIVPDFRGTASRLSKRMLASD